MRLMNYLGYGQLSNPNRLLKLVVMRGGNYRELFLWYFHYISQGFRHISFLESISSNTKDRKSHLDHTIIFEEFMSYLTYDVFGDLMARDS